jgi:hypothetical protein
LQRLYQTNGIARVASMVPAPSTAPTVSVTDSAGIAAPVFRRSDCAHDQAGTGNGRAAS